MTEESKKRDVFLKAFEKIRDLKMVQGRTGKRGKGALFTPQHCAGYEDAPKGMAGLWAARFGLAVDVTRDAR